jgi:1-acyl-sn-glycerol-3-phosphate acyltransferase
VRHLLAALAYLAAAIIIFLTLPVVVPLRVLLWPVDRHGMVASRALRFLGEVLIRAYPYWKVTIEGSLPPPPATFVCVPNHRSMVDALAVACVPREMKWIGKRSAFLVPWFGWALRVAGHVPVLRGDKPSGRAALARLRGYLEAGIPVGLFAEGTRSRDGALRDFRPGPFKLAIEAGVPVVPVAIHGAGQAMPPDAPWIHPSDIRIRILPPVPTAGLGPDDVDRLRREVRDRLEGALQEAGWAPPGGGPTDDGPTTSR